MADVSPCTSCIPSSGGSTIRGCAGLDTSVFQTCCWWQHHRSVTCKEQCILAHGDSGGEEILVDETSQVIEIKVVNLA